MISRNVGQSGQRIWYLCNHKTVIKMIKNSIEKMLNVSLCVLTCVYQIVFKIYYLLKCRKTTMISRTSEVYVCSNENRGGGSFAPVTIQLISIMLIRLILFILSLVSYLNDWESDVRGAWIADFNCIKEAVYFNASQKWMLQPAVFCLSLFVQKGGRLWDDTR